ncbi:MAG: methyltransferase domain-containing protein [Candidatus Orphnella occulta]|nr:methyltransferase domain-containing protein [Candidatus Orphnella occulta]
MKKLISYIIIIAIIVNIAAQSHALRAESAALSVSADMVALFEEQDKSGPHQEKSFSAGIKGGGLVTYDRLGESSWYKWLNASLADMAGLHPGERILEIGAGPGISTAILLDKMKHRGKIIAIEPNSKYLDVAAVKLKNEPVELILANVQEASNRIGNQLPVDKAFLFNSIHVIKGHETLFDSLFEIVKPGGILAFNTAYFRENNNEFRKMQRRIFVKLLRNTKAIGKDIITKDRDRLQMRSVKNYEESLKNAGFEITSLERKIVKIPFLDIETFYRDKSVTDYIAPLLTAAEREELIMPLVMDEINLARKKGKNYIEGEWLYIVSRNTNDTNIPTLFIKSRMLSHKTLPAEQNHIRAILQAA